MNYMAKEHIASQSESTPSGKSARPALNQETDSGCIYFDSYRIWYSNDPHQAADIVLYMNLKAVGRICFYEESIVDSPELPNPDLPTIFFHIRRFNDVITILREESPLYLCVDRGTHSGYISTALLEPVGEEEGT